MTKLNFYTEKVKGGYVGLCRQDPSLRYGPKKNRDTALSGVKRLANRVSALSISKAMGTPVVQTKKKINLIVFAIDRSGSMQSFTSAAVKALNGNIKAVEAQARATGQETLVGVVSFDNVVDVVRPLQDVRTITTIREDEVQPRGMTALFDAVAASITLLEAYPEYQASNDYSCLVISVTDGEENSSRTSSIQLSNDIRVRQASDRWTFTFIVPPGYGRNVASWLGVPEGNVTEWNVSVAGINEYTQRNNQGLQTYFAGRTNGVTSTKGFYQTNLGNLKTSDIKKSLNDISSMVKVMNVEKEQDIRTFVENKLGQYKPGSAFYQLTKDEKKVQDYKELLVMEKGKKAVFAGPDARRVLGLPDGELKIRPGNHGNFDIFVQSTSNNRKLVRGTKLIVKP